MSNEYDKGLFSSKFVKFFMGVAVFFTLVQIVVWLGGAALILKYLL